MLEQLSIFDMPKTNSITKPIKQAKRKVSTVRDIRSEGQQNRTVAFDVGEKIGGARKDLAKKREEFLSKPSVNLLDELEKTDVATAAAVIVRNTFFKWFSFEVCRERGVEPSIAKAIQLFINRIPKESKDSPLDRRKYVKMLTCLSDILRTVKTKDEYYSFEDRVIELLRAERTPLRKLQKEISEDEETLSSENNKMLRVNLVRRIEEKKARLFLHDLSLTMALREYPGPFQNYFAKSQSRVSSLQNAFAIKSWNELIPPTTSKEKGKKGGTRKPVWERELPEVPMRSGGDEILIENPKQFIEHFGFRSSEFGLYVDDGKGKEHLRHSAEAYTDLAKILEIPTKAVSLKGELAMAFGSRGRGRALGHYEPARKVINLTKERGSLGILAHEWFHSLDHYLFNHSHSFENGKVGFITDEQYGEMPHEVIDALNDLLTALKSGNASAFVDVRDGGSYQVRQGFIDIYDMTGGNLEKFMDIRIMDFDEKVDNQLRYIVSESYRKKQEEKYARQRAKFIRTDAEAVAEYHFKRTGEKVDMVSYPTERSNFYQHAINLDKGSVGKYWSSHVELAARAFECYVYEKLIEKNWTSDYLVCGIRDSVFPQGIERTRIFEFMSRFVNVIRPFLSE